jgi:cellobiose PTS system EIIB component
MIKSYSIAEARDHFTTILREVDKAPAVEITRHGEPVAVLVSWREYQRLISKKKFWDSYHSFRKQFDLTALSIDPEIFPGPRDQSLGRDVSF